MKISIITATYNSAKTLQHTIDSLLSQSFSDWEQIIVDGGSTDNTLDIVHSNELSYNQRGICISGKDTGIYNAINKGIEQATGEIIGILNSDDVLASNHVLQEIAATFERTQADAVYGDLLYCKGDNVVRRWKSNNFRRRELKYGWMPAHPTFYCRREVYRTLGQYDEHLRISADYDFMLRVLKRDYRAVYIPDVLVKMQVGGISNRNLHTILLKSKEDAIALHRNHIGCGWLTILVKNIRKTMQFLR